MSVTRERAHTFTKNFPCHEVGIAVSRFLSSLVPPPLTTPKWAFVLLCQLEALGRLSLALQTILCLLPLHTFPLSGFCFSSYQTHTFISPWKRSIIGPTLDSIDRWSREGLKLATLEQTLMQRVGKFVCYFFCLFWFFVCLFVCFAF